MGASGSAYSEIRTPARMHEGADYDNRETQQNAEMSEIDRKHHERTLEHVVGAIEVNV